MKWLRAILDRGVAYPAGNDWSGDTEDRKVLRLGTLDQTVTCSFSNACGSEEGVDR